MDIERAIRLKDTTVESLAKLKMQFDVEFDKSIEVIKNNMLEMPQLPRQRKVPAKHRGNLPEPVTHKTIEDKYRTIFNEIIETTITQISDRFDDVTLKQILKLAHIIKGDANDSEIDDLMNLNFYNEIIDFDKRKI